MVEEDENTASGSPCRAPGLHVAELFGTKRKRVKGEYLPVVVLGLLCPASGLHVAELFGTKRKRDERRVSAGSCSRRRKISDFKTRTDRAL